MVEGKRSEIWFHAVREGALALVLQSALSGNDPRSMLLRFASLRYERRFVIPQLTAVIAYVLVLLGSSACCGKGQQPPVDLPGPEAAAPLVGPTATDRADSPPSNGTPDVGRRTFARSTSGAPGETPPIEAESVAAPLVALPSVMDPSEEKDDCTSLCGLTIRCEGWIGEDGNPLSGEPALKSCVELCNWPPEGTTYDTARTCLMKAVDCEGLAACDP